MIRRVLTAAAVAAACTSAQAGVVYNWVTVSTSPTITAPFGRLEVTQSAYQAGSLTETFRASNPAAIPGGPVQQFTFGTGNTPFDRVVINAGDVAAPFRYSESNFSLILGDTLSGSIYAIVNNETDVKLTSAGSLFTVAAFNIDNTGAGSPCSVNGACSGATGRFVLDRSTVPVPGVLPLMALGAFGVAGALRRRRTSLES